MYAVLQNKDIISHFCQSLCRGTKCHYIYIYICYHLQLKVRSISRVGSKKYLDLVLGICKYFFRYLVFVPNIFLSIWHLYQILLRVFDWNQILFSNTTKYSHLYDFLYPSKSVLKIFKIQSELFIIYSQSKNGFNYHCIQFHCLHSWHYTTSSR